MDFGSFPLTTRDSLICPLAKIKEPAISKILYCRLNDTFGRIIYTTVEIMYKFIWCNEEFIDYRIFQGNNWGRIVTKLSDDHVIFYETLRECKASLLIDTLSGIKPENYLESIGSLIYHTTRNMNDFPYQAISISNLDVAWINGNPSLSKFGTPNRIDVFTNDDMYVKSHPDFTTPVHKSVDVVYDINDTPLIKYDVVALGYSAYQLNQHIDKWLPYVKPGGYLMGKLFKRCQVFDIVTSRFPNVHKASGNKWVVAV